MEEEQRDVKALWESFHKNQSEEERDALIIHYLPLVKLTCGRVAAGLPSHIKMDDLYSSGITGLIRAIEKYDSSRGGKFESYASLLIKGAIIDELRELDWIPRSVHQKANLISGAQTALQQKLGREPSDEEICAHLGLVQEEFEELLYRIRPAILISLNSTFHTEENPLSERIPDDSQKTSYEIAHQNEFVAILEKAIADLPEQERRVLTHYYYDGLMLKEIGKILGVSESRISQIHTKALLHLRSKLHQLK